MQAIVYHQYGSPDVLQRAEVAQPTPASDEVLVKIHATSVNAADWLLLNGESIMTRMIAGGLNAPKKAILGGDMAGTVEAVGNGVTQFKPGDAVYGDVSACRTGGFAEYIAVPEKYLARKPANLSFAEAAAFPLAGGTALQGVRDKGRVQAGQHVMITGASGGVGAFAVQIAHAFGANVTAVCSTSKMAMVRQLGADAVIDYTRTDITQTGARYDVILDIAANRPFSDFRHSLNPGGSYIVAGGAIPRIFGAMLLGPLASLTGGKRYGVLTAQPKQADLQTLTEMIEAGRLKPVIDRCYPLAETADALRYFGSRKVQGKIVITVV